MATNVVVDNQPFELVPSEVADNEVSLPGYDILSYPADFTLEVLVDKWKKGDIIVSSFQRRYIWQQWRASKLIESFLMGLPVPPVFFYMDRDSNKLLVVDGHQRLRTIVYFFSGIFGEPKPDSSKDVPFELIELDPRSPYYKATYLTLKNSNNPAYNKLNNSVLRSFVVKQVDPNDDTSIFQIFERLNTGGVILQGQEIRNCIYEGTFATLLDEMNKLSSWRKVFGAAGPDKRMRDTELILRFLALHNDRRHYKKPMKQFLNTYMKENRRADHQKLDSFLSLFTRTSDAVLKYLGETPFHIRRGMNAAVMDSVFIAFAENIDKVEAYTTKKNRAQLQGRFKKLTRRDKDYLNLVSTGTTDEEIIPKRIAHANTVLFS
jgi:hypothetical protein